MRRFSMPCVRKVGLVELFKVLKPQVFAYPQAGICLVPVRLARGPPIWISAWTVPCVYVACRSFETSKSAIRIVTKVMTTQDSPNACCSSKPSVSVGTDKLRVTADCWARTIACLSRTIFIVARECYLHRASTAVGSVRCTIARILRPRGQFIRFCPDVTEECCPVTARCGETLHKCIH